MLQAGCEAAGTRDEAGGDMTDHGGEGDCWRPSLPFAVLACFLLLATGIAPRAAATEASIEPGGFHVERKDATSGSTLKWEWHASSDVIFSISRVLDAATILYSSEGTANSSALSISTDDTYLLLWENQGNDTAVLDFTIQVDVGSGPVLIFVLVVVVVIGTLASIFIIVTRRDRARRAKGPKQPRTADAQPGGGRPSR
jgi:hypothetical protein